MKESGENEQILSTQELNARTISIQSTPTETPRYFGVIESDKL